MIGFPQTRLVKISTPYMKSGVLHDDFTRGFGQDNPDLLVWRASTALMNPTIKTERLERERRLDPSRFAREFEAEFAEETDAFLPYAWVEDAVRPIGMSFRHGTAFSTTRPWTPAAAGQTRLRWPSATPRAAAATHALWLTWSRAGVGQGLHSVDLTGVVAEIATVLKRYRVTRVIGDRYAGQWVPQAFATVGMATGKPRRISRPPSRNSNHCLPRAELTSSITRSSEGTEEP